MSVAELRLDRLGKETQQHAQYEWHTWQELRFAVSVLCAESIPKLREGIHVCNLGVEPLFIAYWAPILSCSCSVTQHRLLCAFHYVRVDVPLLPYLLLTCSACGIGELLIVCKAPVVRPKAQTFLFFSFTMWMLHTS